MSRAILISDELHRQIRIFVAHQDIRINEWTEAALQNRIDTGFSIKK